MNQKNTMKTSINFLLGILFSMDFYGWVRETDNLYDSDTNPFWWIPANKSISL